MSELAKSYEPSSIETKWYEHWQSRNLFASSVNVERKSYSILMPPPNVTGILTMGHVINHTVQDLYIRYNRMSGSETKWLPGLDHAGIATQTKVEQELRAEGQSRRDLGRERFVERVMEWKEKYGGIILQQLRALGNSCDWSETLFTMDERASHAVREVFIRLFDEGLIYRGKRIINWSPLAQSALSDEEVVFREVKEQIYTLRYKFLEDDGWLTIATARPETLFGDVAVAVNPNDERYKNLIGKLVRVPLVGRLVPIIADEYADPTFGTGAVKITPAHDPNDFEVGIRHNLEAPNSINPDGTLNDLTGEFAGLDRFEARERIVETLKKLDLIEKIEDYTHNVGFSERGGEPIEPYLSDQWFVRMKPLAEPALRVVQDGDIRFFPEHWVKTYENWMTNIRDWCISRQLWWGHRIPVFYLENGSMAAAHTEAEARVKLGIGTDVPMRQDEDVLDTWFSSWLWPLTTMNWLKDGRETNKEMDYYLPTNLLVTGPDIIFFWVARMIMASLKFTGKIPFKDVYFTSIIRDGKGRKMSKSLGNSPDPLKIIAKYGADALRFTITYLAPMGTDVRFEVKEEEQDTPQVELGRNFANKIWNAGRFLLMKREQAGDADSDSKLLDEELTIADRWILSRYNSTIKTINTALANYRLNDYSKAIYDFIWRDFCDWYVEIFKAEFNENESTSYRQRLSNFGLDIFDGALRLLHPLMPFITEELWQNIAQRGSDEYLCKSALPVYCQEQADMLIESKFELLQEVIEEIRKIRGTASIPPGERISTIISTDDNKLFEFFSLQKATISALARCTPNIGVNLPKPEQALSSVVRGISIFIDRGESFDKEKEIARLTKEFERLSGLAKSFEAKLNNPGFLAKAKPEIIETERQKQTAILESLAKVRQGLAELGA